MKKILTVIFLIICFNVYSQDTAKTDSADLRTLKAKYIKLQKEYFDWKDELMRYEGRLQMLEVLIREEELKLRIKF